MRILYEKIGKRYYKIPFSDFMGFPCDGVFLVWRNEEKSGGECILQIGELPKLYPFANMAMAREDLANFLVKYDEEQIKKTGQYDEKGKLVRYTNPSATDFAGDILKFLAELSEKKNGTN